MVLPDTPNNEDARLGALREYSILDSLPEEEFEGITLIASEICKTPISLITFIDSDRQWFKSNFGLKVRETPRDYAFCGHAINNPTKLFSVKDARLDSRFLDNPLVTGYPNVVFYAGVPLVNPEGYSLGTLCVIDNEPRELNEKQQDVLRALSRQVEKLLELRRVNRLLQEKNKSLFENQNEVEQQMENIGKLQRYLEVSERGYRELVDDSLDLIYELDAKGRFKFINNKVVDELQFGKEEIIGASFKKFIHPDDLEKAVSFYSDQVEKKMETSYLELRLRAKDNHEVWVGQNIKMYWANNEVYKVNAIARDISQIKQSELKAQKANALLRTIVDNVPINIYAKDKQLRKILANKAEYEYLGFTSENEVLGKSDFDTAMSEFADEGQIHDQQVLDGESIINFEAKLPKKDGSTDWLLVSKLPLRNGDREIEGIVGISLDITQQKKINEQLEKSEKLFRLISENSKDVISLHSLDGIFLYISPSCINLHGYSAEELIGTFAANTVYPPDLGQNIRDWKVLMDKMMNNIETDPVQFRLLTKNKGPVWVEAVVKPVFEREVLSGYQVTLRDISIRKKIEEDLEESKVAAEQAANAKSQFLSTMSHEIRTPLNGIIGLTDMLSKENPRADQTEKINLLKFSSQNLLSIVNDILDFSKIESGKINLEIIAFDLKGLIKQFFKTFEFRNLEKGIELKLDIDQRISDHLMGDSLRLGQVINNLVSNAIKFTTKGYVQLSVIQLNATPEFQTIRFSIKDTGIGIPNDKLSTIFEMFTQASIDTTRKFGGTGLGLSITKKLLSLMGSEIAVESELGRGSTFSFDIQLKQVTDLASTVEASTVKEKVARTLHLLVVDDNQVNLLVASSYIKGLGHSVVTRLSGHEALETLKTERFHLIFMDLQMPVMDGYEAVKNIREQPDSYFKRVPIIALSADAMAPTKQKAKDEGMTDFLAKPFELIELEWILSKYGGEINLDKTENQQNSIKANLMKVIGGDEASMNELVKHVITNLRELESTIFVTLESKDTGLFERSLHKSKTMIKILKDDRLSSMVAQIKEQFAKSNFELGEDEKKKIGSTINEIISDLN